MLQISYFWNGAKRILKGEALPFVHLKICAGGEFSPTEAINSARR